jgi:L-iditol 2-dehydrogenase
MKVAVWYNNQDIRIEEVEKPVPGKDEMLVKIIACGLCGSDIVEWYRLPRAPLIPGHEIGGEVVETGLNVNNFKPGDRVFIAPKVPCLSCRYCESGHYPVCSNIKERLPGGLAEYILVPNRLIENGTYLLPNGISNAMSTFIEPLACVLRAQSLAQLKPKHTVMIFGCGMSGLLHVKLAKAINSSIVAVDLNRKRLDFASKLGAQLILDKEGNVSKRLIAGAGRKADVVILCTSAMAAIEQAWECVDKGGRIVFFAVPEPHKEVVIPINKFWMSEVSIITSYYCGPPDILKAIQLLETGTITVDDMITHQLPLCDVSKGYQLIMDGNESIKVIIRPHL